MSSAPFLRTETDLPLKNAVFANTPAWLQEKGITSWCAPGQEIPGCVQRYEGESFPGQVSAKTALEIAYNHGYAQGYEGREPQRVDLAALDQAIREGRLTRAELAVENLGHARGVQEQPTRLPPSSYTARRGGAFLTQIASPTPSGTSRSVLSQLLVVAALTSPAWLTIFVLPRLGRKAR